MVKARIREYTKTTATNLVEPILTFRGALGFFDRAPHDCGQTRSGGHLLPFGVGGRAIMKEGGGRVCGEPFHILIPCVETPHTLIPCVDDSPHIDSFCGGPSPPSEDEGKEEEGGEGGRMSRLYILISFGESPSHIDPLCGEPPPTHIDSLCGGSSTY